MFVIEKQKSFIGFLIVYNFKLTFSDSENNNKAQEGSSFESASSLYSSTKTDNVAEDLIVPSFSPPLEISDDFMVPNLSSPPLPLSERIAKPSVERFEVKVDITPIADSNRRNKTDPIKPKDDLPRKPVSTEKFSYIFHRLFYNILFSEYWCKS